MLFLAAAFGAVGSLLPQSVLKTFYLLLPSWLIGALVILFGILAVPLPLLRVGKAIGNGLTFFNKIPDWIVLSLAFTYFFALSATLSGLLFHHLPHVNDTINQYVHAKFIASGHIAIDSHPLRQFFDSGWMINDGKWYSPYPPVHVLLLALGHLVGFPWLVNPLVGAFTVIAIYALARELYDKATARLALLFACFCPWLIFMSSEYMNHATALLFATLFILYFMRTLRTRRRQDAALAGTVFGMMALTRPYTAFALALPYAALGLWYLGKHHRAYCKPFIVFLFMLLLCALFQGWWNLQTTGNPWINPYQKFGDYALPGLGTNPLGNKVHTFFSGVETMLRRIPKMNQVLFEWPVPSLVFVLTLLISGAATLRDWLLAATYGSIAVVYIFFHGRSDFFGPRYHYEAVSVLIVLTASAIVRLPDIVERRFGLHNLKQAIYGLSACGICLLYMLSFPALSDRYKIYSQHFYEGNYDYYHSIVQNVHTPALVFGPDSKLYYLWVAFTLPPTDDTPVIFARDKKQENAKLIAYYPCRHVYIRQEHNLLLLREPLKNCSG